MGVRNIFYCPGCHSTHDFNDGQTRFICELCGYVLLKRLEKEDESDDMQSIERKRRASLEREVPLRDADKI